MIMQKKEFPELIDILDSPLSIYNEKEQNDSDLTREKNPIKVNFLLDRIQVEE